MKFNTIRLLPEIIYPDDPEGGVLRPWVRKMGGIRHQGVILTAIRGCDTTSKEDMSKPLVRMIRRATCNPYDWQCSTLATGFFGFRADKLDYELGEFLHSLDQYPLHFVTHVMLTCEVIGYKSPEYHGAMAAFFLEVYRAIVKQLHLKPETETEMDNRLNENRIVTGTEERDILDKDTRAEWLP